MSRKFEREHYTTEEIRALLTRTSSDAPSAVRNAALITTLWQTGVRINEALELRPSDFDLKSQELFVRKAKGGRFGGPQNRRVLVGPEAVAALVRWLKVREGLGLAPTAPLFSTLAGTKMHATYVRTTLQRLAKAAGWTKRVHPHGFRHTHAVTLSKAGVPVDVIRRQLGHHSLSTTSIYLQTMTMEDVKQAMSKVEW